MAGFALLSLASAIEEERGRRLNLLFALFCFAASLISFVEVVVRLAGSVGRATTYAYLSALWPAAPVLFLHFTLLLATGRRRMGAAVVVPLYSDAVLMAVLYLSYIRDGRAVTVAYGFSLTSPVALDWPYWIVWTLLTSIHIASFGTLVYGARMSRRAEERRQIRWILFSYAFGVLFVAIFTAAGRLFAPPLPELTGLSYASFAVLVFVGILNRRLILLTPKATAEHIVRALEDLIVLTDEEGLIVSANDSAVVAVGGSTTGASIDAVTGTAHPGDVELGRNGNERRFNFSATPMTRRGGTSLGTVYIGRDVTADREREQRLSESVAEKESLLGEVHHRVKNSLQLVISIIDLKAFALAGRSLSLRPIPLPSRWDRFCALCSCGRV